MTKLIHNEPNKHALHTLNYHKIREGLFNVTKWHDNGFNRYLFESNDIKEQNETIGKQLKLHINANVIYTVTYIYGINPDDPTILIKRYDMYDGTQTLNDLAHPKDPNQTNKMYDILYHVEKTIKRDLQSMESALAPSL